MFRVRNITALLITLVFLIFVSIIFFIRIANTSLPKGYLEKGLEQVQDTVRVYTNHYGVSHIIANNRKDAFFMTGFLHARDRLWQMDFFRRLAQGQLSEIFGQETVGLDKFMRQLNISSIARKQYSVTDINSRAILESYAAGVNYYIKAYKTKLPFEFNALDYMPEQWTPEDCYVTGKLFAFLMSSSFRNDITFGRIAERIGIQKALELIPAYPLNAPHIFDDSLNKSLQKSPSSDSALLKNAFKPIAGLLKNEAFDMDKISSYFGLKGSSNGSNSWVYRKIKNAPSGLILANDPHLAVSLPTPWYQLHLTFPAFNVTGLTIPGTPLFYSGRNDFIAWGITSSMADDCDFFIEKTDSSNANYYLLPGGRRERFKFVKDTILVRKSTPIYYYKKITNGSAVISEAYKQNYKAETGKSVPYFDKYCLTFSWTATNPSNDFSTMYRINTSKDWASFTTALNDWAAPSLCFTYADINGNLGVVAAGFIPKRNLTNPNLPNPGYLEGYSWEGYYQLALSSKSYNPPNHYIVSANNKLSRSGSFVSNYWEPSSRAERIAGLLQIHDEYSFRDAQIMQSDVLSVYARNLLNQTLPFFISIKHDLTAEERNILGYLEKWDNILSPLSVGASIYTEFYSRLLYNTFQDELGYELYLLYTGEQTLPSVKLLSLLEDPGFPEWFDDLRTNQKEYKNFILLKSFREAINSLKKKYDNADVSKWLYGDLHQITFNHPLSSNKFLEPSVNLGPFRIGGNGTTINNTNYNINKTYDVTKYASMRFVTDMDENFVYTCLPGGQSGDPQSPNYRDQVQLWLNGGFIQLTSGHQPGLGFEKTIVFYRKN